MTIKAWKGPSTIDGKDIMAVVSCEKQASRNGKTGDMVQVAFFSTAERPVVAAHKTGDDESVCGSCPLRPKVWTKEVSKKPCYVGVHWMAAQWAAAMRLGEDLGAAVGAMGAKPVRFGQYGNMSSVLRAVAERLLEGASKWTLYEHEWMKPENQWLRHFAMASVHSEHQAITAQRMGWRTFRNREEGEPLLDTECQCPYETRGVQCKDCLLCDGKRKGPKKDKRKSVAVYTHGG